MKKWICCLLLLVGAVCVACSAKIPQVPPLSGETTEQAQSNGREEKIVKEPMVIQIQVNGHIMFAELSDNSSGTAFFNLLQAGALTVSLSDYGGFEKVGDLPTELPRNDTQITTEAGDIILYLGKQITIYYDRNTWNFTRLGKIRDVDRESLLSYLGSDDSIEVTFSIP